MDKKNYGEMPEVPEIYDYYNRRCEKAYKGCVWSMVLGLLMILIATVLMLTSCTATKVVEVEKVRIDTTYITKWQRDSVWLHDSIMVTDKGDTIRIERWHTKYVEKQVHDTTYVATHDTIPQPYSVEVVKEVEKELSWWQRLRLWIGNIGLLGILGVIGYYGVKLWRVYKFF
jgi:hypothetical protein